MIRSLIQPSTISLLKQIAKFNEQRHEVLAENIARIDTPGYKSRDLPVDAFQQALQKAVGRLTSPSQPQPSAYANSLAPVEIPSWSTAATPDDSLKSLFSGELFQSQQLPTEELGLQDNGKRNIEYEVMEMTRTLMQQSYAMQLINSQYNLLESVISERP
ncbi:hypothetical protein GC176_11260 [bacterium]|nr:hypothetical protein [bacterium]